MLRACKEELLNPYKSCFRDVLNCLACYENEYHRTNIVLRNLQIELKEKVGNIIFQCSESRKFKCASKERLNEFHNNIKNIDNTTECFNKRIKDIQTKRREILDEAKKCFESLCIEKEKLKQFHKNSIDHLKAVAVQSNDREIIKNCEKDIKELNKRFLQEVSYIKKCEYILNPFIQLLHECCSPFKCKCNCLNDYSWMPQGKSLEIIKPIVSEIKSFMGITLRKAFAQLHINQPKDANSFLASYLMTQEYNEEIMQQKLKLIEHHK